MATRRSQSTPPRAAHGRPRCGLCGKATRLTRTRCCGQWVCDIQVLSVGPNCYHDHDHSTLCAAHYHAGHAGRWQECAACRAAFATEPYVYYGTNAANFERLANPPAYAPTHCRRCQTRIRFGTDGYSVTGDAFLCDACTQQALRTGNA